VILVNTYLFCNHSIDAYIYICVLWNYLIMQCSKEMRSSPLAMDRHWGLIGEACSTTCQMSPWLTASWSERLMDTPTSWISATQAATRTTSSYPPKHFWRQIRQNCSSKSGVLTSPDCRPCTKHPTNSEQTN